MKDIMSYVWKGFGIMVLGFIGICLLSWWPIPIAIVVTLFFIIRNGGDIKEIGGKAVKLWLLLGMFFIAFCVMQTVLGIIFDAKLASLYEGIKDRNLLVIFFDPGYLGASFTKQIACLLLASLFAGGYAWSKRRNLYHGAAAICCLGFLCWQAYDIAYPLNASDKARRGLQSRLLRESVVRWWESWSAKHGWNIGQDADIRRMVETGVYEIVTINRSDIVMYSGREVEEIGSDGKKFTRFELGEPENAQQDEEWIIHPTDYFVGGNSKMAYVRLVNRRDENIVKYIRQDYLRDAKNGPKPILRPSVPAPVSTPVPAVVSLAQSHTEPSITTQRDTVWATANGWTESGIIACLGDVIDFGPFESADAVENLLCQVGSTTPIDLEPIKQWDGRYIGRVNCVGDSTSMRVPEKVRLKRGPPVAVRISKVKTY